MYDSEMKIGPEIEKKMLKISNDGVYGSVNFTEKYMITLLPLQPTKTVLYYKLYTENRSKMSGFDDEGRKDDEEGDT